MRPGSFGAIIQGFKVEGRDFAGTSFDWLTPFSVLCGVSLMLGYGLLGAGWLIIKIEGGLQAWARRMGQRCLLGVVAAIVVVSVWTPLMDPAIASRWLSWPNIAYLAPVPVLTALVAFAAWRALAGWGPDAGPFLGTIALFLLPIIAIYTGWSYWVFRGKIRSDLGYH